MNIDYKELALASNRRIEQLVKLETRLKELPQHLLALVPLLDTLVELGNDVQQLDTEAKKMIPADIPADLTGFTWATRSTSNFSIGMWRPV
jgi:hypothetical protein